MLLSQSELLLIVMLASATLATMSFFAGRITRSDQRRQVAAPGAPPRAIMSSPTIAVPRAITQYLTAAEVAELYVFDWRKNGDTYQARLTVDLDRDIRNFCERYGIALLCAQEVRGAILNVGGVSSRREYLKASNPRHQDAIARAAVHGLKSGRFIVWYCSRKAPVQARPAADESRGQAGQALHSPAGARSPSRTSRTPVTRSKRVEQDDLLIGHELRAAA